MFQKRVSGNHNLTIWTGQFYKGYPVNPNNELVTEYLEKLHFVVHNAVRQYPRVLAVSMVLHCSVPTPELAHSNKVIQDFTDALDSRMSAYMKRRVKEGKPVFSSKVRCVWAREQQNSHVPHFHVLLLFNREVFYTLGEYHSSTGSLMTMIRNAWYSALNVPPHFNLGLMHVPKNAEFVLNRSDQYAALPDLFHRASYMCKVETKTFGRGFQCFGGSRD